MPNHQRTKCTKSGRVKYKYDAETLRAAYLIPELLLHVYGMILLYLMGITDDWVGVRYRQKFVVQNVWLRLLINLLKSK